jgi:acyl-CoA synthetase (AMP-forming)/AMP-acid ligase II
MAMPPQFDRLRDYLPHNAEVHPERPALFGGDQVLTWHDVLAQTGGLAKALVESGVGRGDRVAVWSPPSVEGMLLYLTCLRIGAIFVGLNPKYTVPELEHVVADATPKMLLGATRTRQRDYSDELAHAAHLPDAGRVVPFTLGGGLKELAGEGEAISDERLKREEATVVGEDPATIVYTSGTTGKPKGALLTQRGFAWNYWQTYEERYIDWLRVPAFFTINHQAGLGDVAALAIVAGGTQYFMESFDPSELLALIEREQLNYLPGLVTHFQLLFREADPDAFDLSSLEYIWWGGALIPPDVLSRLESMCARVSTDFGQTETTGPLIFTPEDASPSDKSRTIGRPRDSHPVRLADENGQVVERGSAGEIQAYGPQLSPGYFNNPEASAALYTPDGWLRTGDLAIQRPDGYVEIVGRIKEMFKSGGYNVYPAEVEGAISEHQGVEMVAVVPVPDEVYQEVGWAFVSPKAGASVEEEELRGFARERLANYKIPKRFIITSALPRTLVGKIDKPRLRAVALEGHGQPDNGRERIDGG